MPFHRNLNSYQKAIFKSPQSSFIHMKIQNTPTIYQKTPTQGLQSYQKTPTSDEPFLLKSPGPLTYKSSEFNSFSKSAVPCKNDIIETEESNGKNDIYMNSISTADLMRASLHIGNI